MVDCVRAPVDCEPLVLIVPDQPPEAVQELALLADQVSIALPPLETLPTLALKLTTGAATLVGVALTLTVTALVALPPDPLQVNTYWDVALIGPVDVLPLVARDPLHAPDAVQPLAFVEFH